MDSADPKNGLRYGDVRVGDVVVLAAQDTTGACEDCGCDEMCQCCDDVCSCDTD